MSNIIGGEFAIDLLWLNKRNKTSTEESSFAFATGRGALFGILDEIQRKLGRKGRIMIPDYLCSSITSTIIDAGWDYSFYHIDLDLAVDANSLEGKITDAVLLINYFGIIDLQETLGIIHSLYPNAAIILDLVQAFFDLNEKYNVDYIFGGLRKYFPCPDGAFAIRKDGSKLGNLVNPFECCRESAFVKYKVAGNGLKHISDKYDEIAISLLERGEELLEKDYLGEISDDSQVIYYSLDLDDIACTRHNNAAFLHEELAKHGINHFYRPNSSPLFVPICVEQRNTIRKQLFDNSIFTPIHWPHVSVELNGENELYSRELSLICDQRYTKEDMKRELDALMKIIG